MSKAPVSLHTDRWHKSNWPPTSGQGLQWGFKAYRGKTYISGRLLQVFKSNGPPTLQSLCR